MQKHFSPHWHPLDELGLYHCGQEFGVAGSAYTEAANLEMATSNHQEDFEEQHEKMFPSETFQKNPKPHHLQSDTGPKLASCPFALPTQFFITPSLQREEQARHCRIAKLCGLRVD